MKTLLFCSALFPENVLTDLDLPVPQRSAGGSSHLHHPHQQLLVQVLPEVVGVVQLPADVVHHPLQLLVVSTIQSLQ